MISVEASNRLQLAMIILSPTIVGRQQLSTGGASPGTIKSFFHSHHLLNAHPHFLSSSTSFWSTYQQHVCGFKFSDTMVYFPWSLQVGGVVLVIFVVVFLLNNLRHDGVPVDGVLFWFVVGVSTAVHCR